MNLREFTDKLDTIIKEGWGDLHISSFSAKELGTLSPDTLEFNGYKDELTLEFYTKHRITRVV